MNSNTDHYRQKYLKKANEFWTLQQLEKTDEEKEYDSLIKELENMLTEYREEIETLENENEDLQKKIGDAASIFAEYQQLKEEQNHLLQLQTDITRFRNP